MLFRRLTVGVGVAVAALALPATSSACPFCSAQGQTLSGEINQADFIVLGTLTNPRRDPADFTKGTTDLVIDTVIKPHDYLAGKKAITLPRFVPADPAAKDSKYLVFCSLYGRPTDLPAGAVVSAAVFANPAAAQLDAYRGEPVKADSRMPAYLKGAIEVRQKDSAARLRFFFDYLDSPELVVSTDALMEFGNADYKDVRGLAEGLPASRLIAWLKDPNTAPSRFGLYGLLLGHCGKQEDAKALREILDDPSRVYSSGLDGLLVSYVLLDRKAGWEYLTGLLADPSKEFPVRYAGLKVLRFFWEYRPDVVAKDKLLDGARLLVGQSDMADLPVEDLRKWGCWDQTEFVLQMAVKESHNKIPIVRRAILRFALSAPADNKAAAAFVEQARKDDADRVKFVEQMLQDEKPKPAASAQSTPAPVPGGGS